MIFLLTPLARYSPACFFRNPRNALEQHANLLAHLAESRARIIR